MQPQIPIDRKKSTQSRKKNADGYHSTEKNSNQFQIGKLTEIGKLGMDKINDDPNENAADDAGIKTMDKSFL